MNPNTLAETFNADGYVVVPDLFSAEEIAEIEVSLAAHIRDVVPHQLAGTVYYEDDPPDVIKSVFKLDKHSATFATLAYDPRVIAILEAAIPGEMICTDVGYFAKAAHDGSVTPPHQDNAFRNYHPPYTLKASIALDPHTEANGAMICLNGSHLHDIFPHRPSGVMSFSQTLTDEVDVTPYPEVSLCMSPGDVAIHHGNTIHKSSANQSDQSRRMISMTYKSSLAIQDEAAFGRVTRERVAMHAAKAGE
jgi:phytanoyl-CoA hydroxylase